MKLSNLIYLFLPVAATLVVACGGASDSTQESPNNETSVQGVFIDSPVEGLRYNTETKSGITDSEGTYHYILNESIQFSIGDLTFPRTIASSIVTPIELGVGALLPEATTINIARLLQSLDVDGIPENGIKIPDTASDVATSVNFDVPVDEFESNADVINLVANSGSVNGVLIDANVAMEHLLSTLSSLNNDDSTGLNELIGFWQDSSTGDYINIDSTGAIAFYDFVSELSCHELRRGTITHIEQSLYLVETDRGESQQLIITRIDNGLNILFVGTLVLVEDSAETRLTACA